MKTFMKILVIAAAFVLGAQSQAQDDSLERAAAEAREAERRMAEEAAIIERLVQTESRTERERAEVRVRMEEAERRLAEAARQIAELSQRNLPQISASQMRLLTSDNTPRLGITINTDDTSDAVDGVTVSGITPGGAAADAGLEAGDQITAINDESLAAENARVANEKLLDFMRGVESGDKLKLDYLRDGNRGSVELEPRQVESNVFAWRMPEGSTTYEFFPGDPDVNFRVAPEVRSRFGLSFAFPFAGRAWSDLEIIELSEGLGRYFGTDSGLLVVSAPKSGELQLQDGDVIKSIDGREPESVGHAMRILSSYEPGESLDLNILRDKRKRTLKIEMPDDRRGLVVPPAPPLAPAGAPVMVVPEALAPSVIVPDGQQQSVIIVESET
ncbi:MAG: PDZ domain-containing protein [Pseudomonadota bacterium]